MNDEILHYLWVLRRYAFFILFLCVASGTAAYLIALQLPSDFSAATLVLVRPQQELTVANEVDERNVILDFPLTGMDVDIPANTYIEIIKSRALVDKVVRGLGLDQPGESATEEGEEEEGIIRVLLGLLPKNFPQLLLYGRELPASTPLDDAIEEMQKNLAITVLQDTYVLEVKYTSEDPRLSADVANAVAEAFLGHMVEIADPDADASIVFLEAKRADGLEALDNSRDELRAFKNKNRTLSFDNETASDIRIVGDLEGDLFDTLSKLANLRQSHTPSNTKVKALEAERDALLDALEGKRKKLAVGPDLEQELKALELQVSIHEEMYELLSKEYEEAELRAGKRVPVIQVVSPAVAALKPDQIWTVLLTVPALALSLLFGTTLAFMTEYLVGRLRTVAQVESSLDALVVATIPDSRVR